MDICNSSESNLKKVLVLSKVCEHQKVSEILELVPCILSFSKDTDHKVLYHTLSLLNFLDANFDSELNQNYLTAELYSSIPSYFSSMFTEIPQETMKLLSLLLNKETEKKLSEFVPWILTFLENSPEDEYMEYGLEMLKTFPTAPKSLATLVKVLDRIVKTENVNDCLGLVCRCVGSQNRGLLSEVVMTPLFGHILFYIGFNCLTVKLSALKILGCLSECKDFVRHLCSSGLPVFLSLFEDPRPEVLIPASSTIEKFSFSTEFLSCLSAHNFAPTLISLLTHDATKSAMLTLLFSFFSKGSEYEIMELVENNAVAVLCRIIERDAQNRVCGLLAMEVLLDHKNDLHRAIANECRFSRLLSQLSKDANLNELCNRILKKHYCHATLTVINTAQRHKTRPKTRKKASKTTFPSCKLHRRLKHSTEYRVSKDSGQYLAGVLEFLSSELLDLAGAAAKASKAKRIAPKHLIEAIQQDSEFSSLLSFCTLSQSKDSK